jgi:copper transport protein
VRRLRLSAFIALAVLMGFAALIALPGVAGAHALLKSSTPAAGADLPAAPHQILMTFTEPPDPTLSLVTLVTSSGATVKTGKVQPVAGQPAQLLLPVPSIPNGVYTVNWRTVSKTDGHVVGGSFAFGINTVATATSTSTVATASSPTALALVSRWLAYIGLALMVGGAALRLIVRLTPSPRAVKRLLMGALGLAFVGLAGSFLAEAHATGASLTELAKTSTARPDEMLGLMIVLLAAISLALVRRPAERGLWFALGGAGIVAMFFVGLGSHANNPSGWRWFNLGVELAHLVSVGIWIGGLVWLFVAIRGRLDDDQTRREGVVRFSTMAAVALAVVAASGLGRALDELNGLHSLWSSSFGKTVLVKVALFGVLLLFGALNHYRIVPAIRAGAGTGTLVRSVRLELGVAAVTIFAGVWLSQLPPASYATAPTSPASAPLVVTGSDFGTTVRMQMTMTPGTIGSNTFDATVVDFDTGAPIPAVSVTLNFSLPADPDIGGSSLTLTHSGTHWTGTGSNLSVNGTWAISAVVQEQVGAVSVPLKVTPKLPPEQISTIPGTGNQPTIYTITLGGGFSVQTYVQQNASGVSNVHFTFFQSSGAEQPIASATATETSPTGATSAIKLIRFDPGHFAANTNLTSGAWTFTIQAKTTTGIPLTAYFTQPIT